jgi:hypothetical protein
VETLGVCEAAAGLTCACPRLVVLWVEEVVEETELAGGAAVAAWSERASPMVVASAATEPTTSPRLARAARRRAMEIGVEGIDSYVTTSR